MTTGKQMAEKNQSQLTHFDSEGNAVMVDVSTKAETERVAHAAGTVTMSREAFRV